MSDLVIKIGANAKEFSAELDSIKRQTKELEDGLAKTAKISGIAFAGLTASAGLAVGAFSKFDNELRGVRTLLDETSFGAKGLEKGFADMRKEILQVGKDSGQDLSKLNKALFDTVSAGVDASKAVETVGVAAKLAVAGLTDVSVATDGMTSALNAYGLGADQANEVASKFFTAQKFGKTTIEELSKGFGLVGASAQAAGIDLNELLGAVSAVTTAGVQTNAAYTGLKAAIANISKPTKEAADEAKRLGVSFDAASLRTKGLEGFLNDLTKAQGFTKDSVTKLFGSVEAQNIIFALTGTQAQGFARNVRELGDSQKTAATFAEAFKTQSEGAAFQTEKFKSSIQVLAIKFGEKLEPAFSKILKIANSFIDTLTGNDVVLDFATSLLKIGIAATGLVTVVTTATLAFIKARTAIIAADIALKAMGLSVKTLVGATGIGLLVIVAAEVYNQWDKIWPAMTGIFRVFTKNVSDLLGGLGKLLSGVFSLDIDQIQSGFDQVKGALSQSLEDLKAEFASDPESNPAKGTLIPTGEQIDEAAQAAKAAMDAQREKEKQDAQAHEEEMAALRAMSFDQRLEQDQEFKDLLNETNSAEREAKLEELSARYAEDKALQDRANEEQLKQQVKDGAKRLKEQEKFGKAWVFLNSAINSETVKGFNQASSELVQLTQSNNSTLKGIGKAAAVAQITQRTAMSAMNVFEGFTRTVPPPFGPALGAAGAAAAVAFGAEQISRAVSANTGGIVPGIGPNVDSVPAILTPGELVVPRQNFDEVIDSVARNRGFSDTGQSGGSMAVEVLIGFTDDAFEIIEQKLIERRITGTAQGSLA